MVFMNGYAACEEHVAKALKLMLSHHENVTVRRANSE
jgi:hypothetical protein